jgi:hypothetical protein
VLNSIADFDVALEFSAKKLDTVNLGLWISLGGFFTVRTHLYATLLLLNIY